MAIKTSTQSRKAFTSWVCGSTMSMMHTNQSDSIIITRLDERYFKGFWGTDYYFKDMDPGSQDLDELEHIQIQLPTIAD